MLMVPVRAAPGFGATLNATAPLPEPLAPEVTVTHAALLLAVHAQPSRCRHRDSPGPSLRGYRDIWRTDRVGAGIGGRGRPA